MADLWSMEQLKSELTSRGRVKGFIVTEEHVHRRERYFLLDSNQVGVDQDRNVHSKVLTAKVFVDVGRPGRQGEITKKLFAHLPLNPQLESAIDAAAQTDHEAWELPTELPKDLPQPKTSDPKMSEDLEGVTAELTRQIGQAVAKPRKTRFDSAELFLSTHDRTTVWSNGLTHRSSQSRIYAEAAYSFSRKLPSGEVQADEYLNTQWSVGLQDLSVEKLFAETSDYAEHSLGCPKPKTGAYSVLLDADVLLTLLNNHVSHLSGGNVYHQLPHRPLGEAFIPGATGDLLTIELDPGLDYGPSTTALSDQGIPQQRLLLVDQNRVTNWSADQQFARYLGRSPTTARGNVVVAPGKLSFEELTRADDQVLEILQFSGLFADPVSGTFSSEIRLARLYDRKTQTVTYVKGGSLSGAIAENFKGLKLCKERVKRASFGHEGLYGSGYFGPSHALLTQVSVVG